MARSQLGAALTRQHLLQQTALRSSTIRLLLTLWATVDPSNLAATIGPFTDAGAALVQAANQQSASLALRYVQAFRSAEGAGGLLAVALGEPPSRDDVVGLLRGAGLSGIIDGRRRGLAPEAAARNGFVKVTGTATSVILDGGREVVTEAAAGDRASTGRWQRVASAGACAWCAMQASRGPVFASRDFKRHDGCNCSAEPVFEGSKLPATSVQFREEWERAQREIDVTGTSDDALNAFRRLREGRPDDGRLNLAPRPGPANEPAPTTRPSRRLTTGDLSADEGARVAELAQQRASGTLSAAAHRAAMREVMRSAAARTGLQVPAQFS